MKELNHIRDLPRSFSLYKPMHATILQLKQGSKDFKLLYAYREEHNESPDRPQTHKGCYVVVYCPDGHGLRVYEAKERWADVVYEYLPVYIYGAGCASKLTGEYYEWSHAELSVTAILPRHKWQ